MSPLSTEEFYSQNDGWARRYVDAKPSTRQTILEELYKLDLPLFQAWRVAPEEREDYRQTGMLFLSRALSTFKPEKGPFVHWLRFYVQKTLTAHKQAHKPLGDALAASDPDGGEEEVVAPPVEEVDGLFWDRVEGLLTPEEWRLVKLRFQEGLGIAEIATKLGVYTERVRTPLHRALDKIKADSLSNLHDSTKKISDMESRGSEWLRKRDLASRLGLRMEQLKNMLNPNRPTDISPFIIDSRDVVRLPSVRIRYLETDAGLLYPRFIRRGTNLGRAGLL